ncbi:MAG: type IV toxin-antitoxin system AbiEi family antitoxin [Caulobacterales bacterium]|nr:type IV toxin-antitoxin system AbiEi family antitoxin [Caulobacterales bacterium]MCA0373606.1 type IV toxin-antitoxin system AbiEi family antitoxin [Pseudomonadota bacterium]
MSIESSDKLKTLLYSWKPNTVMTYAPLRSMNITPQHMQKYVASGWVVPVGSGAFIKANESVSWQGALYTLQNQTELNIHLGGLSALEEEGHTQYLRMGEEAVQLFSEHNQKLPTWFKNSSWGAKIVQIQTGFLPKALGIRTSNIKGFEIKSSCQERAILECLYLAPQKLDLIEAYEILEGMRSMRPNIMQQLLESCQSIKVKRLFLFMAEKAKLPILEHLDTERLELGSGARALIKDGFYDAKYKLILPKGLAQNA